MNNRFGIVLSLQNQCAHANDTFHEPPSQEVAHEIRNWTKTLPTGSVLYCRTRSEIKLVESTLNITQSNTLPSQWVYGYCVVDNNEQNLIFVWETCKIETIKIDSCNFQDNHFVTSTSRHNVKRLLTKSDSQAGSEVGRERSNFAHAHGTALFTTQINIRESVVNDTIAKRNKIGWESNATEEVRDFIARFITGK